MVVESGEAEADDAPSVVKIVGVWLAGGGFFDLAFVDVEKGRLFKEFVRGNRLNGKDSPTMHRAPPHRELRAAVEGLLEHGGGGGHRASRAATRAASSCTAFTKTATKWPSFIPNLSTSCSFSFSYITLLYDNTALGISLTTS